MADTDKLLEALRNAQPSWTRVPNRNSEGYRSDVPTATPQNVKVHDRTDYQAPWPENTATAVESTTEEVATNETYSFRVAFEEFDNDAGTITIHIADGEINDEFPDGMSGSDDYFFTYSSALDGEEIYAIVTYDTDTLAITSRSLGHGIAVPDSTLGTLYVPIGFVDIDYDPSTGDPTDAFPHNRHCGDIRFELIFGTANGVPVVIPVAVVSEIVEVPFPDA